MKIGIFADAHNNAVALEAVLRTLEGEKCDILACAGDIIGIGPWPEETVQRLMRIPNLIAVRGNHERYLLEGMPATYPNDEGMDEAEMAYHRWEHSRLSAASIAFLRALPDPSQLWVRVAYLLAGVALNGLGSAVYIGSRLGPGPRDGVMTGLVRVTGRSVRPCLEVTVVVIGFALGGNLGLGTLLYALAIGPIIHAFLPHVLYAPAGAPGAATEEEDADRGD